MFISQNQHSSWGHSTSSILHFFQKVKFCLNFISSKTGCTKSQFIYSVASVLLQVFLLALHQFTPKQSPKYADLHFQPMPSCQPRGYKVEPEPAAQAERFKSRSLTLPIVFQCPFQRSQWNDKFSGRRLARSQHQELKEMLPHQGRHCIDGKVTVCAILTPAWRQPDRSDYLLVPQTG